MGIGSLGRDNMGMFFANSQKDPVLSLEVRTAHIKLEVEGLHTWLNNNACVYDENKVADPSTPYGMHSFMLC